MQFYHFKLGSPQHVYSFQAQKRKEQITGIQKFNTFYMTNDHPDCTSEH
jgi:hypothetical protein